MPTYLRWQAPIPYHTHVFLPHISLSWTFGGDHVFVKNPYVLVFSIAKTDFHGRFRPKISSVCRSIFGERLLFLTTRVFPCHKIIAQIFLEIVYLLKNHRYQPLVSSKLKCPFIVVFIQKHRAYGHRSSKIGSYSLPSHFFLSFNQFLQFLLETISS